ncbi:MAG TPA: extracellular solute-binding protein [bacterium]|nr:extracellular solute-binding protein [bacterium]
MNQKRNLTRARGLSRRDFVKTAGLGAAAVAGAGAGLFGGKAPAFAQGVTLHTLQLSNFAPAIDETLNKQAKEFEKLMGCTMRMEYISLNDVMPRTVASVEAKSGPDVILLEWNKAWFFGESFADVGDVMKAVGGSKMHKFNIEAVQVKGVFRGVPYYNVGSAMTYNKPMCAQLGVTEPYPDTYDDLLKAGAKMKKGGYPVGWCLGHTIGDGCFGNYPIIWAFGGAEVNEKGRVVINSQGTKDAIDYMRQFWNDACDEGGMAWDDSSNNRAFLGKTVACVLNAASIYLLLRRDAAKAKAKGDNQTYEENTKFAGEIVHTVAPKGPKGRFELIQPYNHHVPTYTKNMKLAKEWIRYMNSHQQYEEMFVAGGGFAQGVAPEWDKHSLWDKDPPMKPFRELAKFGRNLGYAGPYGRAASEAQAKYIIADMLARGIKGDTPSAIAWAEKELKLVYEAKA